LGEVRGERQPEPRPCSARPTSSSVKPWARHLLRVSGQGLKGSYSSMVALGGAHDGGAEEQEQRGDEQRGAPPQPVEQVAGDEQRAEAGDEVEARGRRLLRERSSRVE